MPERRRPAAVIGHHDHGRVVVEPGREPADRRVDLGVRPLDDRPRPRRRRGIVQRRRGVVKRPEAVVERVGDPGEADHQLEAAREVAPDGALEPLELDAVRRLERRDVERLHRRRGLVVRERARGSELRRGLGGPHVRLAPVRKRETRDDHPVRDVPRWIGHRDAIRERPDGRGLGGVVEQRLAAEVGGVHQRLAEARVVARVEVLEAEDAVLAGLLAGQERGPGRSRHGRTRRAQPRTYAARHEPGQRRHLSRGDERVDDFEGRPVDAEEEGAVSHLGVIAGSPRPWLGTPPMRETCRMRGDSAAGETLHRRATSRARQGSRDIYPATRANAMKNSSAARKRPRRWRSSSPAHHAAARSASTSPAATAAAR